MSSHVPARTFGASGQKTAVCPLTLEHGQDDDGQPCIVIRPRDPEIMASALAFRDVGGSMDDLMHVAVCCPSHPHHAPIPFMAGSHEWLKDGVRFRPVFPFEPGLRYRATFGEGRCFGSIENRLELEFSLPSEGQPRAAAVTGVYPSGDSLPENVLRFYVTFGDPMERGHADREILILGPDGAPAPDVLYRAPVELWDRNVRALTILLDPGRLKRGVGPNRLLGPPLSVGQYYSLVIGPGMTTASGRKLGRSITKRFHVLVADRRPVLPAEWNVGTPRAGSQMPLTLGFSRSLDWAAVRNTIAVVERSGELVAGRIATDLAETRWTFTPERPWMSGAYDIQVDPMLEDPCGNNVIAAFDRAIPAGSEQLRAEPISTIPFNIED